MCVRSLLVRSLAAAGVLSALSSANASIFYSQNFESGTNLPEWSSNQNYSTANTFSRFLGRYTNSGVTLSLPQPARPNNDAPGPGGSTQLLLEFHLYIIDSWDGSETTYGPDHFGIRVGSSLLFDETFANQHTFQTYDHDPNVGRAHLGFDERWMDSIYYMALPFDTASPTISLQFFAYGLHGAVADESWGIDNVRLSVVPVPAPGAAGLGLIAGAAAFRRRRRI
ncbi:MAG: hypothetical protein AB7G11_00835 [Phycisphaerales bacterium]